ncbi:MAG: BrxA/BrxB family bacilliredoxin [Bacteroidia bacterium]
MYPSNVIEPIRQETVEMGMQELTTPSEVDNALGKPGTALVLVNSVCGCTAASARPAVAQAIKFATRPQAFYSVFAGVDVEAVDHLRKKYLAPNPPSSPAIALFKDGKLVHFLPKPHIEGKKPEVIAQHLEAVFQEYCS